MITRRAVNHAFSKNEEIINFSFETLSKRIPSDKPCMKKVPNEQMFIHSQDFLLSIYLLDHSR